eukprot:3689518-Pyramimonas_sp.AAC.1
MLQPAPPAPKRRRKGASRLPQQLQPQGGTAAASLPVTAEPFVTMTQPVTLSDKATDRPTTAADDILHAIEFHCRDVPAACVDK